MDKKEHILVLGGSGMVGSSIFKELKKKGYTKISSPSHSILDLTRQDQTLSYFKKYRPKYVFFAAAKVGGILANNIYRADFILDNLQMEVNVFHSAFKTKVRKLLFLGSSCIYPKNIDRPICEEDLLTGQLEPTNEPYAIAKIAGIKMAENLKRQYGCNFISVMPTNLYGKNDNYHQKDSHVIPGLIARMHQSLQHKEKNFKVWGSGKPKREFLHVDDLSRACVFLMEHKEEIPYSFINVGTGIDISIKDLASMIAKKIGFKGKLIFDTSFPDGMMRKRLNVSRIRSLGWSPQISLEEGISQVIHFHKNFISDP